MSVALLGAGCISFNDNWVEPAGESDGGTSTSEGEATTVATTTDDSTTGDGETAGPTTDDTNSSSPATTFGTFDGSTGSTGTDFQECPNGVVEEPEDCDDNNYDEGDGCSDMCHDEPYAVELDAVFFTDVVGVANGDFENHACAEEGGSNALHGVILTGEFETGTISSFQADCAFLEVAVANSKLAVVVEPMDANSPPAWGVEGDPLDMELKCGPGEIVRGFRATTNGYGLTSLELACEEILMAEGPDGFGITAFDPQPPYTGVVVGYPEGPSTGYYCPLNNPVAAGFKLFRREVLETLDLSGIEASGYMFQIEQSVERSR